MDRTPLAEIGLPVRVTNSLERYGIHTLGELLRTSSEELEKFVGLSAQAVSNIERLRSAMATRELRNNEP